MPVPCRSPFQGFPFNDSLTQGAVLVRRAQWSGGHAGDDYRNADGVEPQADGSVYSWPASQNCRVDRHRRHVRGIHRDVL